MLKKLEERLKNLEKVAISYSGGIDSTFLLYVANRVLPKENVLAVIANGSMMARKDYEKAMEFLTENHFQYKEIFYNPLKLVPFKENHKDRCYHCKKNLMEEIKKISEKNGFMLVLDGKNADDLKQYRPGNKAGEEIGIVSPLAELGFCKENIRKQAKDLKIKSWNQPSNSCLATRFPYDTTLTQENLKKAELSEELIKGIGLETVRVRIHKEMARIEIRQQDFDHLLKHLDVIQQIKNLGFQFVTLDLCGWQSGSFDF